MWMTAVWLRAVFHHVTGEALNDQARAIVQLNQNSTAALPQLDAGGTELDRERDPSTGRERESCSGSSARRSERIHVHR